jgi:hypothetical protein
LDIFSGYRYHITISSFVGPIEILPLLFKKPFQIIGLEITGFT